jgi:hypothetical protein
MLRSDPAPPGRVSKHAQHPIERVLLAGERHSFKIGMAVI